MDVRRLLVVTTIATAVTALVGVLTATTGAGLTCEARWPLCDGAVFGLFPATFMSFIEWSHRLVAMLTGFLIIASTLTIWHGNYPRRIKFAMLAAVVLTPIQVIFGAFTVLVNQFVFGYSILVLILHFVFAAAILTFLIAATAWAYAAETAVSPSAIRQSATVSLAGIPILVVLTPRFVVAFGEITQFLYYGIGFATFATLCLTALWARELAASRIAGTAGIAAVLIFTTLIIARQALGDSGQFLILMLPLAALIAAIATRIRTRSLHEPVQPTQHPSG